ncbi:MAG: cell division protein FtsQ/DivIB, partial [Gaiellales bacterium]
MEAVLGGVRGRMPGISRLALLPLVLLAGVCCLGIGVLAFRMFAASGAFDIQRVEVTGGGAVAPAVRASVVRQTGGQSLLDVDPARVAAALAALPQVHVAAVDRAFPNTLAVRIVSEVPVAVAPVGASRFVLAASGRVLGVASHGSDRLPVVAAAPADLPGIGGVVAAPGVRQELR